MRGALEEHRDVAVLQRLLRPVTRLDARRKREQRSELVGVEVTDVQEVAAS
jgi:hypothetical protein